MMNQFSGLGTRSELPSNSNAPSILAVNGVFTFIALVVVVLRVYVRAAMLKFVGSDDYVIVAAMASSFKSQLQMGDLLANIAVQICGIGVFACFVGKCKAGVGKHVKHISLPNVATIFHWIYFHSLIVMVGISLVKISIALFLLRLVPGRWYQRFLWGMIVFLILFTVSCAGTLIFACVPIAASWDFALKAHAKCFSSNTFTAIGLYNSTVNILTDVVFAFLPIPVVWNLQVNKRTKITLTFILGLGFFACAASIYKTYLQTQVLKDPDLFRNDSYFLWNSVELNIGILAASLPTLRPLFARVIETTRGYISSGGSHNKSSGSTRNRGAAGYYKQNDSIGMVGMPSDRDKGSTSKNVMAVTTDAKTWKNRSAYDDDSEEAILPPAVHARDRISVKKEATVEWEDA